MKNDGYAYAILNGPAPCVLSNKEEANKLSSNITKAKIKRYKDVWDAMIGLENHNKNRDTIIKLHPHKKCTSEPCVSSPRIEYRLVDPLIPREPIFMHPTDQIHEYTWVGSILIRLEAQALSVIRLCRYSIYADSIIPMDMVKDTNSFLKFIEKGKNREKFRIFCISEDWRGKKNYHSRILFTNTKIWAEIPEE